MKEQDEISQAMEQYGDTVYRLALCRLGVRSDAEDVYQEVFIRLFRDHTKFEHPEHLKAWLIRVTVNCCHDLRRSAWFRRSAPLEDANDLITPEQDEYRSLWQSVAALPHDLRTAVYLHYVEGYHADEIAHMVGCRPATIRTRLHRARHRLKRSLEDEDDERLERSAQVK